MSSSEQAWVIRINAHRADGVFYADLVVDGLKGLELRNRIIKYRGPLLVEKHGIIIGIVDLIHCRPASVNDAEGACVERQYIIDAARKYPNGVFALVLERPQRLATPFPCTRANQFYTVDISERDIPEWFERTRNPARQYRG